MNGSLFNKYKIKYNFYRFKQQCKYWTYRCIQVVKQVFIPLAIFQLIRTILFPTPIDVILLLIVFVIILALFLDWV